MIRFALLAVATQGKGTYQLGVDMATVFLSTGHILSIEADDCNGDDKDEEVQNAHQDEAKPKVDARHFC